MLPFLISLTILAITWLLGLAILAEKRKQSVGVVFADIRRGWSEAIRTHPKPDQARLVTGAWLLTLLPLLNHLSDPQHSFMALIVWAWTILPHEAGHFICAPFGWFLMVAGGSIWQVLIWILAGLFALKVRKQVAAAIFFWMIGGHSLINLSVYIRDAQERDLQLILGMDKSRHDWWNLLRTLGLLRFDNLFADITLVTGTIVVLVMVGLGITAVWFSRVK